MVLQRKQPESDPAGSRLNLLVSYGGWRPAPVVDQLPLVLEPLGISTFRAYSGEEAADLIECRPIHIAVVDLDLPLRRAEPGDTAARGGGRILELLRRLDEPPPTVVVRPPQPVARENVRGLGRALREGAFAVVDRPLQLETMLEIMRRILRRYYAGTWPSA